MFVHTVADHGKCHCVHHSSFSLLSLQLLPEETQEQFRSILRNYFSSVRGYLVKEHKAMHRRERQNYQILTSKGELSEERTQDNEAAQKAYDKLLTNTSTLAVSSFIFVCVCVCVCMCVCVHVHTCACMCT